MEKKMKLTKNAIAYRNSCLKKKCPCGHGTFFNVSYTWYKCLVYPQVFELTSKIRGHSENKIILTLEYQIGCVINGLAMTQKPVVVRFPKAELPTYVEKKCKQSVENNRPEQMSSPLNNSA